MGINKATPLLFWPLMVAILFLFIVGCKKQSTTDESKIKPPVRSYVVTARVDKKGTNSNSEGTALLHGEYQEETKVLSYKIDYTNIVPQLIALRSGAKGTQGSLVKELFKNLDRASIQSVSGTITLSPLQERALLKGQWFVVVNTLTMSPEIAGILTLKQK